MMTNDGCWWLLIVFHLITLQPGDMNVPNPLFDDSEGVSSNEEFWETIQQPKPRQLSREPQGISGDRTRGAAQNVIYTRLYFFYKKMRLKNNQTLWTS